MSPLFVSLQPRLRSRSEAGFTLIELLIVIVIIGILAGIAIPVLLGQKSKSHDVTSKATAREAARAMETCGLENSGVYNKAGTPCDKDELLRIEPSLADAAALLDDPILTSDTYRVTVWSERAPTEVSFSIRRQSDGNIDRICSVGGQDKGGCLTPGGPGDDW